MVSASLKKNVYGYMYECYTSNTTMYSISFYLIKRKDNYRKLRLNNSADATAVVSIDK